MSAVPGMLRGLAVASLGGLAACTTAPTQSGVLSDYSGLGAIEGRQTKKAELRPQTPPAPGQPLVIETVGFTLEAAMAARVPPDESGLVLNEFARKLCLTLSERFEIVGTGDPQAYRLRAHVTELRETDRMAAAISAPWDIASPIGARAPIGLGAFGAEIELMSPQGVQVAALVWRREADMTSTGASVSRISDAYAFAGDAAEDFGELFEPPTAGQSAQRLAAGLLPDVGLKRGDEACAVYGRAQDALRAATGFLPAPKLPPEWTDKGAARPAAR